MSQNPANSGEFWDRMSVGCANREWLKTAINRCDTTLRDSTTLSPRPEILARINNRDQYWMFGKVAGLDRGRRGYDQQLFARARETLGLQTKNSNWRKLTTHNSNINQ